VKRPEARWWMRCGRRLDHAATPAPRAVPAHRFPHRIHMSDPAATLGRWALHPRFHRAHRYWRDMDTEQQEP